MLLFPQLLSGWTDGSENAIIEQINEEENLPFQATWSSLKRHLTPQWFKDAKFGIYTHWGIYCVPAKGPNATWYPYNMYR
ncbi:MAG: alpha-L-fucosidase, partial [Anaerolineaceae bacterium]|nr:alpha-L-fucosidase [Anaerolineaceae bacterium]